MRHARALSKIRGNARALPHPARGMRARTASQPSPDCRALPQKRTPQPLAAYAPAEPDSSAWARVRREKKAADAKIEKVNAVNPFLAVVQLFFFVRAGAVPAIGSARA